MSCFVQFHGDIVYIVKLLFLFAHFAIRQSSEEMNILLNMPCTFCFVLKSINVAFTYNNNNNNKYTAQIREMYIQANKIYAF